MDDRVRDMVVIKYLRQIADVTRESCVRLSSITFVVISPEGLPVYLFNYLMSSYVYAAIIWLRACWSNLRSHWELTA